MGSFHIEWFEEVFMQRMNKLIGTKRHMIYAIAPVVAILGATADALTIDWTTPSNSTWATGTNWVGGVAPANDLTTDIARFKLSSYSSPAANPTAGTTSVNGIIIGDGLASTGTFTLGAAGSQLSIGNSGILMNTLAAASTISAPTTLGANQSWINNSANLLTITGSPTRAGFTWGIGGSGNLTFSAPIIGTGAIDFSGAGTKSIATTIDTTGGITVSDAGNVSFTGSVSGSGSITMNGSGNLTIGNTGSTNNSNFSGGIKVNNGKLTVNNGGSVVLTNYNAGTGLVELGQTGSTNSASISLKSSNARGITADMRVNNVDPSATVAIISEDNGNAAWAGSIQLDHDLWIKNTATTVASTAKITIYTPLPQAATVGSPGNPALTGTGITGSKDLYIDMTAPSGSTGIFDLEGSATNVQGAPANSGTGNPNFTGNVYLKSGTLQTSNGSINNNGVQDKQHAGLSSANTLFIADGASYNYSNNQYVSIGGLADYPGFSSLGTGRVYNSTNSDQARVVQIAGSGNYTYGGTIVNGTASGTLGLAVSLTGSGTQVLTNDNNSYTGPTDLRSGVLSISNIKDGGNASHIGQASNLATKMRFSGGTLKYTGAGDSTDRLFQVFAGGGAIDSSGAGALVFTNTGVVQSPDTNTANGNATIGSNTITLAGLNFFMYAVGQVVSPNTYFPSGGTITAINREKQTITLNTTAASTGTTVTGFVVNDPNTPGSGTNRTFTLKGTNTGNNSIAASMYDSNLGGKLGITKADAGKWSLTGTRYNSGPINITGGTLEVGGADVPAVNGVAATTGVSSNVVAVPNTAGLVIGQPVSGGNVSLGSIITAIDPNVSITLSANTGATGDGPTTLNFGAGGAAGNGTSVVTNTGTFRTLAAANIAGISGTGTTDVTAGNLKSTAAIRQNVLSIADNASAEITQSGGASSVSAVKTLTIGSTSSKLELHDNDLIVEYGANPSSYTTVVNQVKSGLVLLGGTGSGIASSEVDNQTVAGTMLAVVDDGDPNIAGAITSLSGFTVPNPTASVLVKYTRFGDSNLDGVVDGSDYALIDTGFTSGGTLGGWVFGDYDYSGTVDGSDYALIDTGFISQTGALPEPTIIGLLGLGSMGMLRRRNRTTRI